METKRSVNFLEATTASIRHTIRGIDDSYNNYWDILAELAQNSVDAINQAGIDGRIEIEIKCQKREIVFSDNGCGIAADDLPKLLNLFSSGKTDDPNTIGEKGVGLKFVLFQSEKFIITTSDGKSACKAAVKDAITWKTQSDDEILKLNISDVELPKNHGTRLELYGVGGQERPDSLDIFSLNVDQMVFLLRTKTALGNTQAIWDDVKPISIQLDLTDLNGINHTRSIKYQYFLPTESCPASGIMSIKEFEEWNTSDKSDSQKRNKLNGKLLHSQGETETLTGRKLRYWACFMPSRKAWDELSITASLATSENLENEDWLNTWDSILMRGAITVSTKGMPTAITIAPPSVGNAGYLPNFFILLEDNHMNFDIGRKSFHGKTANVYKKIAKDVFNKFTHFARYSAGALPASESTFNREEITDAIKAMPDLNSPLVRFKKLPQAQEASVVAIFFELIGNGKINDIEPLYMGYQNRYDLYAKFQDRTVFIEFKSNLRNIIKDFSDYTKIFDEMNYIVCWDVNDEDVTKLAAEGIEVLPYELPPFTQSNLPVAVTHQLQISNVSPVWVIDLKKIVFENNSSV